MRLQDIETENIVMYDLYLGLTKREIKERIAGVLSYAELERFADTKLKTLFNWHVRSISFCDCSSSKSGYFIGRRSAIGRRCFIPRKKLKTFMSFKQGKTIVFVTHSLELVKRLCERAIFIQDGKIQKIGRPNEVVEEFYNFHEIRKNV